MNDSSWGRRYRRLSEAIGMLIEDFSLVRFLPLNINKEESISDLLSIIDNILQYGEDSDVKVKDFDPPEDDENKFNEDPTNYFNL